jgi:hypothetical protein
MVHPFKMAATIASIFALAACASSRSMSSAPPNEALRASLGKMGIVSVVAPPQDRIVGPIGRGRVAAAGTAEGVLEGVAASAGGGPIGLLLLPVVVVVGGIYGGVHGAVIAIPESTAKEMNDTLHNVLVESEPQGGLRQRVLTHARTDTRQVPVDLGIGGVIDPATKPDYSMLAEKGVESVLEVGVMSASLVGQGGSDPEVALSLGARARLIRVSDSSILWSDERMMFTTERRKFSEWKADDVKLLKATLAEGLESIGRRISDRTLLEVWSTPRGQS